MPSTRQKEPMIPRLDKIDPGGEVAARRDSILCQTRCAPGSDRTGHRQPGNSPITGTKADETPAKCPQRDLNGCGQIHPFLGLGGGAHFSGVVLVPEPALPRESRSSEIGCGLVGGGSCCAQALNLALFDQLQLTAHKVERFDVGKDEYQHEPQQDDHHHDSGTVVAAGVDWHR